jgi:hypothetical protein
MTNPPKKPFVPPPPPRVGAMQPPARPPIGKPPMKKPITVRTTPAAPTLQATLQATLKRLMRRHRRLVLGAGAVLTAVLAFAIFYPSPTGCTNTPERKRAMRAVVSSKDPVTGATLDGRFDPDDLACRDTSRPRGVVVSARESSGESVVWFFDASGVGHNVNLLAQAFTPAFKPAAVLPPEAAQAIETR